MQWKAINDNWYITCLILRRYITFHSFHWPRKIQFSLSFVFTENWYFMDKYLKNLFSFRPLRSNIRIDTLFRISKGYSRRRQAGIESTSEWVCVAENHFQRSFLSLNWPHLSQLAMSVTAQLYNQASTQIKVFTVLESKFEERQLPVSSDCSLSD